MKKWLIAVMFGAILVLGACGGNGDNNGNNEPANNANNGNETVDVSAAEAIYKDNCASCHGADLSGENGPDLTEIGSQMSQEEIAEQIENGSAGMPANLVQGEEADTLSQWLADKK